jgi:hypothetical protein
MEQMRKKNIFGGICVIEIIREANDIQSKSYNTKWNKIEITFFQQQQNPTK